VAPSAREVPALLPSAAPPRATPHKNQTPRQFPLFHPKPDVVPPSRRVRGITNARRLSRTNVSTKRSIEFPLSAVEGLSHKIAQMDEQIPFLSTSSTDSVSYQFRHLFVVWQQLRLEDSNKKSAGHVCLRTFHRPILQKCLRSGSLPLPASLNTAGDTPLRAKTVPPRQFRSQWACETFR
jgi:hypothetical protein